MSLISCTPRGGPFGQRPKAMFHRTRKAAHHRRLLTLLSCMSLRWRAMPGEVGRTDHAAMYLATNVEGGTTSPFANWLMTNSYSKDCIKNLSTTSRQGSPKFFCALRKGGVVCRAAHQVMIMLPDTSRGRRMVLVMWAFWCIFTKTIAHRVSWHKSYTKAAKVFNLVDGDQGSCREAAALRNVLICCLRERNSAARHCTRSSFGNSGGRKN